MSEFNVEVGLELQITDAEAKKAAKAIEKKLAAAIKPIEIKVTMPTAGVNRSIRALESNVDSLRESLSGVTNELEDIASTAVTSFRVAGRAKDRFKDNVENLNGVLRTSATRIRTIGQEATRAFSTASAVVRNFQNALQSALNRTTVRIPVTPDTSRIRANSLRLPIQQLPVTPQLTRGPTLDIPAVRIPVIPEFQGTVVSALDPIRVRVLPEIEESLLRALPPVPLSVIPVVTQSAGLLQPIPVPILPLIPNIAVPTITARVIVPDADIARIRGQLERAIPPQFVPPTVTAEVERIADAILDLASRAEFGGRSLQELGRVAADMGFDIETVDAAVRLLEARLGGLNAPLQAVNSGFQELVSRTNALSGAARDLGPAFDGVERAVRNVADRLQEGSINEESAILRLEEIERQAGLTQAQLLALARSAGVSSAALERLSASGRGRGEGGFINFGILARGVADFGREMVNLRGPINDTFNGLKQLGQQGFKSFINAFSTIGPVSFAAFDKLKQTVSDFSERVLTQATRRLIQFGSIAAGVLTGLAVRGAAGIEQLKVSLEGLEPVLGDSGVAFEKITTFAARTPFTVDAVSSSVIQLASAMGLTIDQSLDFLTVIGDIGAATGASSSQIELAVRALTQMSSVGRLTA